MGNKRFKFGSKEFSKALKVFGWTVASAVVVLLIDWVGEGTMPSQYVVYVPLVNTLLYGIKEWIADNSK